MIKITASAKNEIDLQRQREKIKISRKQLVKIKYSTRNMQENIYKQQNEQIIKATYADEIEDSTGGGGEERSESTGTTTKSSMRDPATPTKTSEVNFQYHQRKYTSFQTSDYK